MPRIDVGIRIGFRGVILLWLGFAATGLRAGADDPPRQIEETMRRATTAMVEKVAVRGGYVWNYLPDLSRRWGELEARDTMIWIQPPGTPAMGHVFLDAYHATGDEVHLRAAEAAADALVAGQHPAGGWNYVVDFAGEESLRDWYATVGKSAWRLEEFQHYYGNATFDDGGTIDAAMLLLRLTTEKDGERFAPALERAIGFVLASQHASGGWPQRFPKAPAFSKDGRPDYTAYLTFNDDVAAKNIEFLVRCHQVLGGERFRAPIARAMNAYLVTQQPEPQPGWALQYTQDLKPAGARGYEPRALATHTTVDAVEQLIRFYRLTGEAKFLAPVPAALAWLESVRLPEEARTNGRTHPTFVEIETGRTLYLHRSGSNVVNGKYFADYDAENTIGHYSSTRQIDVAGLRARYEAVKAEKLAEVTRESALLDPAARGADKLPRYFARGGGEDAEVDVDGAAARARRVMAALNADGFWLTPLWMTSHPYCGDGGAGTTAGDFSRTLVGDETDTSLFRAEAPVAGISTAVFIRNMNALIAALDAGR